MCVKINWRYLEGIFTKSKIRVSLALFLSLLKSFRDCCIKHGMKFKLLEFGIWKESPTLAILEAKEHFMKVADINEIVEHLRDEGKIIDLFASSKKDALPEIIRREFLFHHRLAGLLAVFQTGSFVVKARLYPLSEVTIRLMSMFRELGFRPPEIHLSLNPVEIDDHVICSFYDMFGYANYSNFLNDVINRYFNVLFNIRSFKIATIYGIRSVNLANFIFWIDFAKSIETTRDILNAIPVFRRNFPRYFFNDVFRTASRHEEFGALSEVVRSVRLRLLRSSILKSRRFSEMLGGLLCRYYFVKAVDFKRKVVKRISADKLFEARNIILMPKVSSSPLSSHEAFIATCFKLLQTFASEVSERGVELLFQSGVKGLSYGSIEDLFIKILDNVATKSPS